MRNDRIVAVVLTALLSFISLTGYAADEAFDTQGAEQHIDQGITYLKAKKYDAAIKEFEASADIAPEAEPYYYLGYTYYLKSKREDGDNRKKSLENFDKAYEIDPSFSPTRLKPSESIPSGKAQQPEVTSAPSTTPASKPVPAEAPAAQPDQATSPSTTQVSQPAQAEPPTQPQLPAESSKP